jgi:hypothetical protein
VGGSADERVYIFRPYIEIYVKTMDLHVMLGSQNVLHHLFLHLARNVLAAVVFDDPRRMPSHVAIFKRTKQDYLFKIL